MLCRAIDALAAGTVPAAVADKKVLLGHARLRA